MPCPRWPNKNDPQKKYTKMTTRWRFDRISYEHLDQNDRIERTTVIMIIYSAFGICSSTKQPDISIRNTYVCDQCTQYPNIRMIYWSSIYHSVKPTQTKTKKTNEIYRDSRHMLSIDKGVPTGSDRMELLTMSAYVLGNIFLSFSIYFA